MIIVKPNRTPTYKFTVTDRNHLFVRALRTGVSLGNYQRNSDEPAQYVKLQARGHRRGVRRYNQSLPLQYGDYFDVYVYTR